MLKEEIQKLVSVVILSGWSTLVVLTGSILLRNESIGLEYKMIWWLLTLLGFTISTNELNKNTKQS